MGLEGEKLIVSQFWKLAVPSEGGRATLSLKGLQKSLPSPPPSSWCLQATLGSPWLVAASRQSLHHHMAFSLCATLMQYDLVDTTNDICKGPVSK